MNLQNWVSQARAHWKKFQPRRYAALEKAGTLNTALQDAAYRTFQELSRMEEAGYDPQGAWEGVRERYLFPPEEGTKPAYDSPGWTPQSADWNSALNDASNIDVATVNVPHANWTLNDLKKALKGE